MPSAAGNSLCCWHAFAGRSAHVTRIFVLHDQEEAAAQDAKAFAYVRPYDLEVQRYTPGAAGIIAKLARAIGVAPITRLELTRVEARAPGDNNIIEAQLSAQEFRALGLPGGEAVVPAPRKARVFVHG